MTPPATTVFTDGITLPPTRCMHHFLLIGCGQEGILSLIDMMASTHATCRTHCDKFSFKQLKVWRKVISKDRSCSSFLRLLTSYVIAIASSFSNIVFPENRIPIGRI